MSQWQNAFVEGVKGDKGDGTSMSRGKSRTYMGFRLAGDLPPAEEVTQLLGVAPTFQRRKGEPIPPGRRQQPVDVWGLNLIERSEWGGWSTASGSGQACR